MSKSAGIGARRSAWCSRRTDTPTSRARAIPSPACRRPPRTAGYSTPAPALKARISSPTAAAWSASPRSATRYAWRARAPTRPWSASASTACNTAGTSASAVSSACSGGPRGCRPIFRGTAARYRLGPGGARWLPLQARSLVACTRRRRHELRARSRPGVRARRRELLPGAGQQAATVGERPAAGAFRQVMAGHGRVAGAAPGEPVLPHRASQRALLRRRGGVVVRRRDGPHAVLRLRGGRAPLSPLLPGRAGAVRCALLPALQVLVRPVFPSQAPRRATRHRRHLLRRSRRGRLRCLVRAGAIGGRCVPWRLSADRRAAQGDAVRRARARVPALPQGPLRRVQPGTRPRHAFRLAVGRPGRVDPDVHAAARRMALRLDPRAGLAGGKALHRVPDAARLGVTRAILTDLQPSLL